MLGENPNIIILDSNLVQDSGENTGLKIAYEIKKTNPHLPIILLSDNSKVMVHAMRRKLVNDCIDNNSSPEQVREVVRKNARKPLDVAIIGLGQLGMGFMQRLAKSSDTKTVQVFSESRLNQYKNIREFEWVKNNRKINLKETLEEALSNTDYALICTSARHGTSVGKIAESCDRSDLFKYEYKKNAKLSKKIAESGYSGLLFYFTNPIGEILEQSRRTGLEPGQLTSSFALDEARILIDLKDNLNSQEYNQIIREISIVGQHGNPCVNFPLNTSSRIKKVIENAINKAKKGPGDSMVAHERLGVEYQMQNAYMHTFRNLAHLRANSPHTAYCYSEIDGQKGYMAVPYQVSFFPNIRITPNQKKINQLGEIVKEDLAHRIHNQNINIQKYLGEVKN
jgi:malate/lactate dehydrogenase